MIIETDGQVSMFDVGLPSSKMSPDSSHPTTAKTSGSSWKKLHGYQNQPFLFLDMSGEDGAERGQSFQKVGALCKSCNINNG